MPSDDPITVTPLAETAEPVEAQETAPSPQPEAQEPEVASPAAESVEGVSQDPPKPEAQPKAETPKPEKSEREKLIDALTGVEEPKSKDEDDEPPPPAPQDKAPAKPEDTPKEKPAEVPEDLTELTNDSAKALKPGEVRRKINRLITRVKEAETFAGVGKDIIGVCEANGLAPDDYKAWVGIGIGLQRGDPQAAAMLKQVATKAGIAIGGPPPDLEKLLVELEEAVDVSPSAARKLRALFTATPEQPRQPAAPAAAPEQPRQPAPAPTAPNTPDLARERGLDEMVEVGNRWKAKLGEGRWAEIQPRLSAALKSKGQKPPAAWSSIYEAEIEKLVATARPATPQSNLRPGGQAGSSTPAFKTERERVLHKITNG